MSPRKARSPRWHCHICGVSGIGGAAEFTSHYVDHHQQPPF